MSPTAVRIAIDRSGVGCARSTPVAPMLCAYRCIYSQLVRRDTPIVGRPAPSMSRAITAGERNELQAIHEEGIDPHRRHRLLLQLAPRFSIGAMRLIRQISLRLPTSLRRKRVRPPTPAMSESSPYAICRRRNEAGTRSEISRPWHIGVQRTPIPRPETGQLCLDRNLIVISVLTGGAENAA